MGARLDFESEGCRFESCRARFINLLLPGTYLTAHLVGLLNLPEMRQFCISYIFSSFNETLKLAEYLLKPQRACRNNNQTY